MAFRDQTVIFFCKSRIVGIKTKSIPSSYMGASPSEVNGSWIHVIWVEQELGPSMSDQISTLLMKFPHCCG